MSAKHLKKTPNTLLTLSADPSLDRRSTRCRPEDYSPYPKLSAYRDCAGFGRLLVVSATVLAIFLGGISSVSAAAPTHSPVPTSSGPGRCIIDPTRCIVKSPVPAPQTLPPTDTQ